MGIPPDPRRSDETRRDGRAIRVEPTNSRNVTWAEFVEAGLLRSYRREHDVPLKELREFIDRLREEFQVPYPAGRPASLCRLGPTAAYRPARPQSPRSGVLSRRDHERADGPDRAGRRVLRAGGLVGRPAGWLAPS